MHSNLPELCALARERISVPAFPRTAIHAAAVQTPPHPPRKRGVIAAIAAGLSVAAIAAAAEIATQSHVHFTRSGGMVISSSAKMASRTIHSEAEIQQAAERLNFHAILPAGLPAGTKPTQLFTAGADMLAVTYDLPGSWRASHHHLWVFLVNPATMGSHRAPVDRYRLQPGGRVSEMSMWRAGAEQVIAVSNGLTAMEMRRIKSAMQNEAR